MGLRLYGSMRLMKRSTLRAMLELYESLEPRYHKLERSRGLLTRLYLTTRYNNQIEQLWYGQLGRSNEEALRWRLSSCLLYTSLLGSRSCTQYDSCCPRRPVRCHSLLGSSQALQ